MKFESICVVGRGRVGAAVAARLAELVPTRTTDRELACRDADLVLLCVPDRAIAQAAAAVPTGPWIAHTSGATTLRALAPHRRRFSLHPLQTFTDARGPEQLDGAWAAVTGENGSALEAGFELARLLDLEPFALADDDRPIYHAGATVAASFLATLHEVASELMRAAGAPPEALEPLMRRTIDNGFAPTGPHVRGDWETIERHLAEIGERRPDLEPVYRALSEATARLGSDAGESPTPGRTPARGPVTTARTIADARAALTRLREGTTVGLVPTMGALHRGHLSLVDAARAECGVVVASVFVNPTQFGRGEDFETYPRDEARDLAVLEQAGVDIAFLPSAEEMYPPDFQTWVDVAELSRGLEGDARPGHFRGVATVCLKLFNVVRPDRAYFGQKDAQQAEMIARMIRDLALEVELRVLPTVRADDGVALSSRNVTLAAGEREAARALPRALFAGENAYRAGADPVVAARAVLAAEPRLEPDYVELAGWNGRVVLAAAVRVGETRLIDNVVLEGRSA